MRSPIAKTGNNVKTAADLAYEVICDKILDGEFPPGTKLSRRKMAELTGVSMIPVIEALHRLEEEGLVESYPYFGSQVIQLNEQTIQDRYALREAVECQVVRLLARHIAGEDLHRLRFLAAELDGTSRTDHDIFWDRHYRFHLALAEMAGRQSLEKALHRINLFHLLQRSVREKVLTETPIPEDLHMQIVDGIATGDPDEAEKVMRYHIYFSGLIRE
jgi:DNA-binding GntR family transcriptional regulator